MSATRDDAFSLHKKVALILINIIAICFITVWAKKVLMPFVFANLFSFVLLPLADFLERKFKFHTGWLPRRSLLFYFLPTIVSGLLYFSFAQVKCYDLPVYHLPEFKQKLSGVSSTNYKIVSPDPFILHPKSKKHISIMRFLKFHQRVRQWWGKLFIHCLPFCFLSS